jgi:hypothetical protein
MTAAKLRIDLSQGLIEVEGSESFILELYGDFKDRFSGMSLPTGATTEMTQVLSTPIPVEEVSVAKATQKPSQSGARSKPKRPSKEEPKLLPDLDLTQGVLGRLKEFHARYVIKTNYEHNLVFVYYLKEGLGLDEVSEDHLFTCYRSVQVKIPGALRQSILETKGKGWLAVDAGLIRLTTVGRNHVDFDLTKAAVKNDQA